MRGETEIRQLLCTIKLNPNPDQLAIAAEHVLAWVLGDNSIDGLIANAKEVARKTRESN